MAQRGEVNVTGVLDREGFGAAGIGGRRRRVSGDEALAGYPERL